jgi:uncharacterized membrane protein
MEPAHLSLLAASTAFVGTHFLLSHPLRAPLVRAMGEARFLGLYSLVALVTVGWMIWAFLEAPAPDLPGSGDVGWAVATLLTIVALVLFLGSFRKNPAFPDPTRRGPVPDTPRGGFAVTRHPMMWGFALWAIAHLILFWSVRTQILAGAILLLALLGSHLQDRKKRQLLGEAWRLWQTRTSYWPRVSQLPAAGWRLWLLALLLWLALTWAHLPAAGIPAGGWRWLD